MDDKYYKKYIKYKLKYLELKNNKIINIKKKLKRGIFNNSEDKLDDLIFTKESIYSVSKEKGSKFLLEVIRKYFKETKNLILTDGTANIGSDSINLSKHFNKINSIELSEINYKALKNNIQVFGIDNIDLYNDDTNKIISSINQDIIYIDAPWGGYNYKNKTQLDLYLGKINISNFYLNNKEHAKLFIFKVPYNYNLKLLQKIAKVDIYEFTKNDKVVYLILVIDNRN